MRRALELRVAEAGKDELDPIVQLRDLAARASSARIRFQDAAEEDLLGVLSGVLCCLDMEEGRIASYQWKGPFELLEKEPSGAFKYQW